MEHDIKCDFSKIYQFLQTLPRFGISLFPTKEKVKRICKGDMENYKDRDIRLSPLPFRIRSKIKMKNGLDNSVITSSSSPFPIL